MATKIYLYLIEFGHSLKVGVSFNADRRISQHVHDVGKHGLDNSLLNKWVSSPIYNARDVEAACVRRFGGGTGEWLRADFDQVKRFILSCELKEVLSEQEAEKEADAGRRLTALMAPLMNAKLPSKNTIDAAFFVGKASCDIMEEAFFLLHSNYAYLDENPIEGEYERFLEVFHEEVDRIKLTRDFLENCVVNMSKHGHTYENVLTLFLSDTLEEMGFHPFSPFIGFSRQEAA